MVIVTISRSKKGYGKPFIRKNKGAVDYAALSKKPALKTMGKHSTQSLDHSQLIRNQKDSVCNAGYHINLEERHTGVFEKMKKQMEQVIEKM